jgi:hypothetical protein
MKTSHYLLSIAVPFYGFIAGIIAFTRNLVGPGIALWVLGVFPGWLVQFLSFYVIVQVLAP